MGGIAVGAIDRAMRDVAEGGQLGDIAELSLGGARRLELIGNDERVEQARRYNVSREDGQ